MSVARSILAAVLAWGLLAGCRSGMGSGNLLDHRAPGVLTFGTHGERMTDGLVAGSGAAWNVELASILQSGGSAEWDLGRVERIGRAWIQADNDDRYAVLVSTDRRDWKVLWEAHSVPEPGLAIRTTDTLDGAGRFVRLEPRGGDGRYAVAELVLSAPDSAMPWPPRLAQRLGEPENPSRPPLGNLLLLATALGALALFFPWQDDPAGNKTWRGPLPFITAGLGLFLVLTALGYAALHRYNLADDAYISLQYAKNWAGGQGLVFNPGERVEGYTNFLWVVMLAPLWWLSGGDPALMTRASTWLAMALAVGGLGLVAVAGRRVFQRGLLPVLFALLLVAFDDAYVAYTTVFALENHLLVFTMLAGLALALYRPRGWEAALGVTFALVGMTRPDGLLWAATFFVVQLLPLAFRRPDDDHLGLRSLVRIAVPFGALFGAYFLLRWLYFGDLLPNTFHLKVGGTFAGFPRGLAYLWGYVQQRYGLPLIALAAVFFTRATWARWLSLHAVLHALYIAQVGGDFYAGHRFLIALTPNLALLAGVVFERALRLPRRPAQRTLLVAAALAGCVAVRYGTLRDGPYTADLHNWNVIVDNNVKYNQWLKQVARPQSSMVVGDIGATGLFADIRVIDAFGVVDRAVARKHVSSFGTGKAGHEKMLTREEQLARRPTYIKWGYLGDDVAPPGYYIFNDFPLHLRVEGLWVLDDLAHVQPLAANAWHMTSSELGGWSREGDAFVDAPAKGAVRGQAYVNGQRGTLVNSFTSRRGDDATGRLLSPPFPLEGDLMRLLVGGGRDPERLRVSLLVDGVRVFSETGGNWETLGRREWDLRSLRGKNARIEIVDQAKGAWGHILVDEIEQWSGTPNTTGKL